MICVIAAIDVAEGRATSFWPSSTSSCPRCGRKAGCLEYGPMVDAPSGIPGQQPVRPNTVIVVEKWQSPAALEAHLATPHMQKFFADTEGLRTGLVAANPPAGLSRGGIASSVPQVYPRGCVATYVPCPAWRHQAADKPGDSLSVRPPSPPPGPSQPAPFVRRRKIS